MTGSPTHSDRYEAGTLNVAGIAGLGAAVAWILTEGVSQIQARERELVRRTLAGFSSIPGLSVHGVHDPERQVGVISFTLDTVRPEEVAYVLDEIYGIMVRAGLHCSPCAHRTIGTDYAGTVRASFGPFTTASEVDRLIAAVTEIAGHCRG